MGLFDIAFKNIKRNFYNYFLYFASMTFSIMIYFIFTSMQYNTQVQEAIGADIKLSVVFRSTAIVVSVFVAVFIWYSNAFFLRKRKKEIALYSLLGIKKRQIGTMLFYENLLMGIAALAAGILIGSLLSKLFAMILIGLMGFSADLSFIIPIKAVLNTAAVFTVLFLVTSIHGYRLIYRYKLIELFKAEGQGEKAPKVSVTRSITSASFILGGYWVYTKGLSVFSYFAVLITLVLIIIGTFMFFSSMTLWIIKLLKKNERRYFNGINMIGTSQLLYRIKANSRTLAVIAILSATTLTAMGVSASFYYELAKDLQENYGFTYAYASNNKVVDQKVEEIISRYPQHKIVASVDMNFARVSGQWPQLTKISSIQTSNIDFYIISESNYNAIAKARGFKDKIELSDVSEAAVYEQYLTLSLDYKNYKGKSISIDEKNGRQTMKIVDFRPYSLSNSGMQRRAIIVKDAVFKKYSNDENLFRIKGYITENKKTSEALTQELNHLLSAILPSNGGEAFTTSFYYLEYRARLAYSGLIIFIGAFLGLLFLVATGSIIFFKQLSEANDDKKRYEILKNIGVTHKEIKVSISKQIFVIFSLPLVVGALHSVVASTLLSRIIKTNLIFPITITIAAYTIIYMIYYFITVNSYYNIVNPDK